MGNTSTKQKDGKQQATAADDQKDIEVEEKLEYYRKIPVANPGDVNYLLDIGTGEIGLYSFVIQEDGYPLMSGKKEKIIFLEDLLVKVKGDKNDFWTRKGNIPLKDDDGYKCFAELIWKHYELGNKDIKILKLLAGGATGANRAAFENVPESRRAIIQFFKRTERYFDKEYGLQADFQVFVPEGTTEAGWELAATEFLLKVASLGNFHEGTAAFGEPELARLYDRAKGDKAAMGQAEFNTALENMKLPADVVAAVWQKADDGSATVSKEAFAKVLKNNDMAFQSFCKSEMLTGTVAAGGGSTQMTLKPQGDGDELFCVSFNIGNKLPTLGPKLIPKKEPMWNTDVVSDEQQQQWMDTIAQRIETGITARKGKFEKNSQSGFFVGISAFFYCAKACKIAERVISQPEVVAAITVELDKIIGSGGKYKDYKRAMANLMMIRTFVDQVFSKDAYFLFQRNWKVRDNKEKFVATWSFGWFVTEIGMV